MLPLRGNDDPGLERKQVANSKIANGHAHIEFHRQTGQWSVEIEGGLVVFIRL